MTLPQTPQYLKISDFFASLGSKFRQGVMDKSAIEARLVSSLPGLFREASEKDPNFDHTLFDRHIESLLKDIGREDVTLEIEASSENPDVPKEDKKVPEFGVTRLALDMFINKIANRKTALFLDRSNLDPEVKALIMKGFHHVIVQETAGFVKENMGEYEPSRFIKEAQVANEISNLLNLDYDARFDLLGALHDLVQEMTKEKIEEDYWKENGGPVDDWSGFKREVKQELKAEAPETEALEIDLEIRGGGGTPVDTDLHAEQVFSWMQERENDHSMDYLVGKHLI